MLWNSFKFTSVDAYKHSVPEPLGPKLSLLVLAVVGFGLPRRST